MGEVSYKTQTERYKELDSRLDVLYSSLGTKMVDEIERELGGGLLFAPTDSRDALYGAFEDLGYFPDDFELPRIPGIRNQKQNPSCVTQAIARIADYANAKENSNKIVSARYGFAWAKALDGYPTLEGTFFKTGLGIYKDKGMADREVWADNSDLPYAEYILKPSTEADNSAQPFRINGYVAFSNASEAKDYLIKYELPVLVGLNANNSTWGYEQIKANNNVLVEPVGSRTGHAMVIVGWNTQGWIVENSFGEHWADGGRAILPYGHSGIQTTIYGTYDLPNNWQSFNIDYRLKYYPQARATVLSMYTELLLREPENTLVLDNHASYLARAWQNGNLDAVKAFYGGFKPEIKKVVEEGQYN